MSMITRPEDHTLKLEEFLKNHRKPRYLPTKAKPCCDHEGRQFPSLRDMCSFWGITDGAFSYRMSHGYSLEDALITPIQIHKRRKCDDD